MDGFIIRSDSSGLTKTSSPTTHPHRSCQFPYPLVFIFHTIQDEWSGNETIASSPVQVIWWWTYSRLLSTISNPKITKHLSRFHFNTFYLHIPQIQLKYHLCFICFHHVYLFSSVHLHFNSLSNDYPFMFPFRLFHSPPSLHPALYLTPQGQA